MKVTVYPSSIRGEVEANPSKSAMQRAVAAALLAKGESKIYNPSPSDDCQVALEVVEKLGATVHKKEDHIAITGGGVNPKEDVINCGEAGLGIRMFTPIVALSEQSIRIEAEGSLKSRPVDFFDKVLPRLGVSCQTQAGKPPLQVSGPLAPKEIEIDGSLSSQFLTGLLMAYGAAAEETCIQVKNLTSKPYIRLTLEIMRQFGVRVEEEEMKVFRFGKKQAYQPLDYTVEGDWSGAAFLLVAGALGGKVEVGGLLRNSAQSDNAVLEALEKAGAWVEWKEGRVRIEKQELKAFVFDATQCPDLFPPLVALAAGCKGVTEITGAARLTHKESDRGKTLQEEFGKLGIEIEVAGDLMKIHGGTRIKGGKVHSHYDHRIAMACAVAALNAKNPVKIEVAEAVNKSYPEFWEHLKTIGGKVEK